MIDLYTAPTPNGWKVAMVLEELALTYAVHSIDLAAGEQHAPAFVAMNPNGRIPRARPACERGLNIPPSPGRADAVKSLGSAMTTT